VRTGKRGCQMPGVWTENTLRRAGLETALLFVRHVPGEVHKFSKI